MRGDAHSIGEGGRSSSLADTSLPSHQVAVTFVILSKLGRTPFVFSKNVERVLMHARRATSTNPSTAGLEPNRQRSPNGQDAPDLHLPSLRRYFLQVFLIALAHNIDTASETQAIKNYVKILFSILAAAIFTAVFAADAPTCKRSGRNCPTHDNKK
jgi:hypothetical protein